MLWTLLLTAFARDLGAPIDLVSFEDLALGLPACDAPATGNGKLDLFAACVDGACAPTSIEQMSKVLGPATQRSKRSDERDVERAWSFREGAISTVETNRISSIFVTSPVYQTADGLGVGVSASCFIERWASTVRRSDITVRDNVLYMSGVAMRDPNVSIRIDRHGRVSQIQLVRHPAPAPRRSVVQQDPRVQ